MYIHTMQNDVGVAKQEISIDLSDDGEAMLKKSEKRQSKGLQRV